jgi:hypothetical protein
MKITRKVFSGCSSVFLSALLLTGAGIVRADQDADNTPNYGTRAIRITNGCDPEVPAPLTQGTCLTVTPNANWSFDISWFDPVTEKYYLADRSNSGVDIVDTTNDTVLGVVPTISGPNGVVVTTRPHQLWAGLNNSHVRAFSLDSDGLPTFNTSPADVDTGGQGRADELGYDPDDQLILIANDTDPDLFLSFISVSRNPNKIGLVGNQIKLNSASTPQGDATGCGIEQPVYDHGTERFYVAVPCTSTNTNGEILVIDPRTKSVDKVYALPTSGQSAGCFPHGLTLGPRENLLLGCSADNPAAGAQLISLIMDATTGSILATFNQVGGSDEVWYNPGDNNYYLAASNWTTDGKTGSPNNGVLGIINAGSFNSGPQGPLWIQNVKTGAGDHSVAAVFDSRNRGRALGRHGNINPNNITRNRVYVPLRIKTATVCTQIEMDGSCAATNLSTVTTESGGIGVIGEIQ